PKLAVGVRVDSAAGGIKSISQRRRRTAVVVDHLPVQVNDTGVVPAHVEEEGMDRAVSPNEGIAEIAGVPSGGSRVVGRVVEGGTDQGERRVGLVVPHVVSARFV